MIKVNSPPSLSLWLPVAVGVWGVEVEGCSPLVWGLIFVRIL